MVNVELFNKNNWYIQTQLFTFRKSWIASLLLAMTSQSLYEGGGQGEEADDDEFRVVQ